MMSFKKNRLKSNLKMKRLKEVFFQKLNCLKMSKKNNVNSFKSKILKFKSFKKNSKLNSRKKNFYMKISEASVLIDMIT